MRLSITALAGLLISATLIGCGASSTIPAPPSTATTGPPPGTTADMSKVNKVGVGGVGAARPSSK
jgi:hypothetical protein